MCAEKTKDGDAKEGCAAFGCEPGKFRELFKNFTEQGGGEGNLPDCAEMMKSCCGVIGDTKKADSRE